MNIAFNNIAKSRSLNFKESNYICLRVFFGGGEGGITMWNDWFVLGDGGEGWWGWKLHKTNWSIAQKMYLNALLFS